MIVLALDQALKVTGYAVFQKDKLIKNGTFQIPAHKSMSQRLLNIVDNLNKIYADYEFDKIYFEDIQLQAANALTFKHLAYVQATIIMWCGFNNIDYEILPASHWRKILGGKFGRKREEQKQHAVELVKYWYNIDVSSDEADAICLGRAGIQESKQNEVAFNDE